MNRNWREFFNNLKNNIKNFKTPSFLIKQTNMSKRNYIVINKFKYSNGIITDGKFKRYIDNGFISFRYKKIKKDLFYKLILDKEYIFNYNDLLHIYIEKDIIYFIKNFQTFKIVEKQDFQLEFIKNEMIEIDYSKEYLEKLEPNIFSFTEGMLKTINEKLDDFKTFDGLNFLLYTLNHKKDTIEKYISFDRPEIFNTYLEIKGTYKDLDLIKKLNFFNKLIFKDENTKYVNFVNYIMNISPDDYQHIIDTFLQNYELYQKFENQFNCLINPNESYILVDWEELKLGDCDYIFKDEYIKGIHFVDDIIDDKIKFRISDYHLENLIERKIEIIHKVKNYLDYLKELRTKDFYQLKLIIDNNNKVKINNFENFYIPGEEIDYRNIKLEGSNRECYLDYAIRLNLDEDDINKYRNYLKDFKQIIKERMPFYLNINFDYLDTITKDEFDLNEDIKEENYYELDNHIKDEIDLKDIDDNISMDIEKNNFEVYDELNEEFNQRFEADKKEPEILICGDGIVFQNEKVSSYVYDGLYILGGTKEDVVPYDELKVGKYCFYKNKMIDVTINKFINHSHKYKGRNDLVRGRIADHLEKYNNQVIKSTNNYFEYIEGTENIKTFDELQKLDLENGVYTIQNHFIEVSPYDLKIVGNGVIYNDEFYILDIKEQIFEGKHRDKVIIRKAIEIKN